MAGVEITQVFAGIGSQADTLTDRSLVIGLHRKLPGDSIEEMPFDLADRLLRVRRQLARWAADHQVALAASEVRPPACGNDRRRDNYTPLWRIAAVLGGPWPARVAAAYADSVTEPDDEQAGIMLLRDVATIAEHRGGTKLKTSVCSGPSPISY